MYVRLNPPYSVKVKNDEEVKSATNYFRSSRLNLGRRKLAKLEKAARAWVEEWQQNTSGLQDRLKEMSRFLGGGEEKTDFPFGSGQSSSLDVKYAMAQARTLRASFIRSVFSDPQLVVAKLGPGKNRDEETQKAETAVNWTLAEDSNAVDSLKDTPVPIFRDGTACIYGEWERKIERGCDYKTYTDVGEFKADYPSFGDAGISEEEYQGIADHLSGPDQDADVHVEFELDYVSVNRPVYTYFPLSNFIWHPLFAKDMKDLSMYGYHFRISEAEIKERAKRGYYDQEKVEDGRPSRSVTAVDSWEDEQDERTGISSQDGESNSYRMARLVIAVDLDGDSILERYDLHYDMESNKILRVERYRKRRNVPCVIPFRFIRMDGRLLGDSMLFGGLDLYRELNALHRHRSNVRRLTDSVTLIAPNSLKEEWDLGAEYSDFRPGMTIWIPDTMMSADKLPRQLQLYNLSRSGDSMDEEKLVIQYLDMFNGISQGQSGRESAQDPNAPASKTAMLLSRADIRGEDLVLEFARSMTDFVELHRSLYAENAKNKINYTTKIEDDIVTDYLDLDVFSDRGLRYAMKPTKLALSPEVEMNRIAAVAVAASKFGFPIQSKPQILGYLWNDFVAAARLDNPERYQVDLEKGDDGILEKMKGMLGGMNGKSSGQETPGGVGARPPGSEGQDQEAIGSGGREGDAILGSPGG